MSTMPVTTSYGQGGRILAGILLAGLLSPLQAHAGNDPCQGFKWDLRREQALFAAPAGPAVSARSTPVATIPTGQAVDLVLAPQAEVKLLAPPGKPMLSDGAYAGVVMFQVPAAGVYRVALSLPAWIDVLADNKTLPSEDFNGVPGCSAPHKVVTYQLPANTPLGLQLSAAGSANVRVTITPAP